MGNRQQTFPRRTHRRHGMAAVVAVAMIGIVGMAIAAMAASFAHENRRTRYAREESQLRQMLLAATAATAAHTLAWPDHPTPEHWSITLPAPLQSAGATLAVSAAPTNDGAMEARMDATFHDRRLGQTIRYQRRDNKWNPVSVTADGA